VEKNALKNAFLLANCDIINSQKCKGFGLLGQQFLVSQKKPKSSLLNGQRDKLSVLVVIEKGEELKKMRKCFVQFNNLYMGSHGMVWG
jgi:hypothetical protein